MGLLNPTMLDIHGKPHSSTLWLRKPHLIRQLAPPLERIRKNLVTLCHLHRLAVVSSKGCCPGECNLSCGEVNSSAAGEIESPSDGCGRMFVYISAVRAPLGSMQIYGAASDSICNTLRIRMTNGRTITELMCTLILDHPDTSYQHIEKTSIVSSECNI